MAGPYIKLFGSILNSSIWCEAGDTRLVWITLLLLADAEGYVWGAVPGVARQAAVSVEACEAALEILARPDPYSRSREEGGRRIVPVDGGWRIVNARKYREMQTSGQRKASERSKSYRQRHTVTERDDRDASRLSRTEGEEESEGKGEGKKQQTDSASSDALSVLNYWQERTKTKIRSPKAHQQILTRIKARLRDGCSIEDLKACVDYALTDEFYVSKGYARKPDVIWRSAERVSEKANDWEEHRAPQAAPTARHGPTPEELAALDAESDR
jgi:hypothetical protein